MKSSPEVEPRSTRGWAALLIVLSIEAFGGLALLVWAAVGMLEASDEPIGARLSILLALLISWAWVLLTLFGGIRARASWARGSALTIHVLLFAAGTGMLQLGIGNGLLAWALILLALIGFFAAMLARPTLAPAEENDNAAGD